MLMRPRAVLAAGLLTGWLSLSPIAAGQSQSPQAEPSPSEPLAPELPSEQRDETVDVVVHGERRSPTAPLRDPTAAVYVLSGSALQSPGQTAAEALAEVPSVQTTRSGSAADMATASVRGASSAQTPIYLAGIRLNDDLTGTANLSSLPLWMLERIEVYRGHAPADADRFGIGGAILFEPRLPRKTSAGAFLGAGSFGEREARLALAMGGVDSAAVVAMRYHAARGDFSYLDDGGTRFVEQDDVVRKRQNADHRDFDMWTVGRLRVGSGRINLVVNGFQRDAGTPGLQLNPARSARHGLQRWLAGVSGRFSCGQGSGSQDNGSAPQQQTAGHQPSCELRVDVNGLATRYQLRDPLRELGLATEVVTVGQRTGQRLRLAFDPLEWLWLAIGAGQELQLIRTSQTGASSRLQARRHVLRSEIQAKVSVARRAEVVAVAALACHSTAAAAHDETCGQLTPDLRLGARVRIAEPLSVFANLGRYQRVPALGELFGISATVRGNDELVAEQGITADLGVSTHGRSKWLWGYGQLVGFARLATELVAFRRSSLGVIRPYNVGSARVLGAELAAGLSAWRVLHAGLTLTALDGRDVSDARQTSNDMLPFQSRLVVAPKLQVASPAWPLIGLQQASAAVRYRYRSSRVADPAGLIVLESQGQLDLDVAIVLSKRRLALRGRLANVLDQRTFDLVGYPLAGRAGYMSAEAWWQ